MLEAHVDVFRPGRCPFCNLGFKSTANSVYHQKRAHPKEWAAAEARKKRRVVECDDCGKSFATRAVMLVHKYQIHATGDSHIYKCMADGCDKAYPTPSRLRKHMLRWHDMTVNMNNMYKFKKFLHGDKGE